jgi:hypothetical protein
VTPASSRVPTVDALAEAVCDAAGDDPRARVREAIDTDRELNEIGDALVGRLVVEARKAALSWTRIGEILGTNERAAEERYGVVSGLEGPWSGQLADRFCGP